MSLAEVIEIFSYPFVFRALVVGILVALCAAILGVVLVLKGYSLIGHGLADVGFAALSLSVALGLPPLYISMPVVIIASFIIMAVSQKKGVKGDVAIGVAATASLAFGIMVTAMTKGFNMDVYNYMFGSILAISPGDVALSILLAVLVVGLYGLFYNRIFLMICDEDFAKASGLNVTIYQFLISFLTAITIVIGMRMMGTLLISSLIIFPGITARKIVNGFKEMVILSAGISIFCFIVGIIVSIVCNIPTGAGIVAVNILLMILISVGKQVKPA